MSAKNADLALKKRKVEGFVAQTGILENRDLLVGTNTAFPIALDGETTLRFQVVCAVTTLNFLLDAPLPRHISDTRELKLDARLAAIELTCGFPGDTC